MLQVSDIEREKDKEMTDFHIDAVRLTAGVGKNIGRVSVRAARTVGIVVVMIPVDIAFLADAANDLRKEKIPKLCEEYMKIGKALKDLMGVVDTQMEELIIPNGGKALDGMYTSSFRFSSSS